MYLLSTSIEIAASPATVRTKFLDFPSIPQYTPDGFVRSIAPVVADRSPLDLVAGDQLNCLLGYGKMRISPIVQENTATLFSWKGSIPLLFHGKHMFCFEEIPSLVEGEASRTRLLHEEEFTGLLAFIMGESWLAQWIGMREDTKRGFAGFNHDFKAWVEATTSN